MQRYFAINSNLDLELSDVHHIKTVMRMKVNDKIEVVYDRKLYICEITEINEKVKFKVISENEDNSKALNVCIAFSLLNEQKMDYIFQKGTELGASKFIPFESVRSVIKYKKEKGNKKLDRWNKICKEASEQSKRLDVPIVNEPLSLNELVKLDYSVKLLCTLNENSVNIKKVLQNLSKYDNMMLVIGPEGGFAKEEEQFMIGNGFKCISLGRNVLRAETAPLFALSVINYEFME